jgi:SAM-dependent methyltransferase
MDRLRIRAIPHFASARVGFPTRCCYERPLRALRSSAWKILAPSRPTKTTDYYAHCLPYRQEAVTSYTGLAPLYDALLGSSFLSLLRHTFERLVRSYGIRFTSAADAACGTGAFVHYLRGRGVPLVYGMDRSPEMLGLALQKNRGNGTRFLLQEFATLQLPQPVDLITCNFDSLNYLLTTDDLLRALRRFHTNLKPGGHAIFDMVTDHPAWQGPQPQVELGAAFTRVTHWDPQRCIQTAVFSISRNGRSQREVHVQRGYSVAVVIGVLAKARLTLLGVHDFQTLGPVTARTGRAVFVVARRA